jgi:glycosyltransferase involved in cell wall biosynthesis
VANAWPRLHTADGARAVALRRAASLVVGRASTFESANVQLVALERALRATPAFDAVMTLPDFDTVPGAAALAQARHPAALPYAAGFIADDRWSPAHWTLARLIARMRLGGRAHPFFFRPLDPSTVRLACFASARWQERALAQGFRPEATRVVPLGVEVSATLPDRPAPGRRLLWIGRLVPEKGLHLFVDALRALRVDLPDVTLTAVAGQGHAGYRRELVRAMEVAGTADAVTLAGPVPRERLRDWFLSHDALCFYSVNAEPVALVVMEAMAAGIPVVASRPIVKGPLLRDGDTCLCFTAGDVAMTASQLQRALTDRALTERLRTTAFDTVRDRYSLQVTGDGLDRALHDLLGRP